MAGRARSAPGESGTVQIVVTGTDLHDDGKWHFVSTTGWSRKRGRARVREPDLTLTVGFAEARRWRRAISIRVWRSCGDA